MQSILAEVWLPVIFKPQSPNGFQQKFYGARSSQVGTISFIHIINRNIVI